MSGWSEYYAAQAGRGPRELLLDALSRFDGGSSRRAADIGCGAGGDTAELLRRGWRVLAIDAETEAIELTRDAAPDGAEDRLETHLGRLEELRLPAVDLVNAAWSLPFCDPAAFARMWRTIAGSLEPGGRLACQLFGPNDTWASNPAMTFHTLEQVQELTAGLTVEVLREEEEDGFALERPKHWHVFHLVCRR